MLDWRSKTCTTPSSKTTNTTLHAEAGVICINSTVAMTTIRAPVAKENFGSKTDIHHLQHGNTV